MDRVEIGYVARAHGVRGELRVVCHNRTSTLLDEVPRIAVGDRIYQVESARPVAGAYLVALAGVDDRDRAEAMRGRPVSVDRELLELDEDEVLLADLVGLRVERDGVPWGEVVAIEAGPQDRMVVRDGDVERLIPVVDALIAEIDFEGGRIAVDVPDGWPEAPAGKTPRKAR